MIRIGVIGCGRILAAHLRGYRLLREAGVTDFQITALCSRKEADAQSYVKRGEGPPQRPAVSDIPGDPLAIGDEYLSDFQPDVDVQVYTDYRKMLAEAPIDAVNDFTIHSLHHEIAAEAFQQRKHLMTQKPLAVTIKAARQMCDRAADAGVTFGVFENIRYTPETRRLKWALQPEGPLGAVQMALLGNVGTWWAPNQIVAETPWRHKLIEAGGISLDLGPHMFDLVRYVAGEIRSVTARTSIVEKRRFTFNSSGNITNEMECDADDTFYASFATETDATGVIFGSWAGHGEPTVLGEGPVFHGTKGRVTGDRVKVDGQDSQSLGQLHHPELPLNLTDDFALAQHDWLEAIRNSAQPETSGEEGLRDLACAYAVVESAHARREVSVEEVLNGSVAGYQKPINERYGI